MRFPARFSIADVIRDRYGEITLRTVRKFEKLDYKLRKSQLDLEFLNECVSHDVFPTFLRFRVSNKTLRNSEAYRKCQSVLLNEEIKAKKARIRSLTSQLEIVKKSLGDTLSFLDFSHICTLFLTSNII